MANDPDFPDFIRRIRAGDDAAAVELVRQFEPLIRREVRSRIGDNRLNRAFDSGDVSQSVFANFFTRATSGDYQLDGPEQLARLLITMARNRLMSRARNERRLVRDVRRVTNEPNALEQTTAKQPSPSQIALQKEQLDLLKASLSDAEHQIFELRSAGFSWDEVATRLGGSGQARRMQFSRGLDRLEHCLSHRD
jgi:RNA polymerase sigma factor (sigma-70 family)